MARSITDIKQSILDQKALEADLAALNSPSQVAIFNLWAYITAVSIWILEKLWDKLKIELEDIAARGVPGTLTWLQSKVFEFQYDADEPQILQLIDFTPRYPVIDPTKRIITRASVTQTGNRVVDVKAAKGIYPNIEPLDPVNELPALTSYLEKLRFAGTEINVISLEADRMRIAAEIFYDGQYIADTVKANVITAINNYFAVLPFNGVVKISKLEDAIQAVPGVEDIIINEVKARQASQPLGGAIIITKEWETLAGYIISEDTANNTLNDTLIMTLE